MGWDCISSGYLHVLGCGCCGYSKELSDATVEELVSMLESLTDQMGVCVKELEERSKKGAVSLSGG